MKNRASGFLKQIISVLTSMAKAKTLALKNKTSAIKTRLIIFSLLRNKKVLLSSISHKLHALLGQEDINRINGGDEDGEQSKAIVLCNAMTSESLPYSTYSELAEDGYEKDQNKDDKYPDLTHSLFESEELELEEAGGSVIDLVRNCKEEGGEEFRLEDEIDHVADLFIKRFHRQMRLQKQQSFKRYQEMLQRGT